jgi:hypothetical protein
VPCGVEGREVTAHAGADQQIDGRSGPDAVEDCQLAGESDGFKILYEVRDVELPSLLPEAVREIAGFLRGRSGSESM